MADKTARQAAKRRKDPKRGRKISRKAAKVIQRKDKFTEDHQAHKGLARRPFTIFPLRLGVRFLSSRPFAGNGSP
jgi:hypothetical protein